MADEQEQRHQRDSDQFTESSPLVEERPRRPSHRPAPSVPSIASLRLPKAHKSSTIVNLLCVIAFVASSASGFLGIPMTRVLEDVLCQEYYNDGSRRLDGPIDERLCKENAIQKKMAFISAIAAMIDAIVGFLAAFPWGLVADRIGRRPVFALGLMGVGSGILWNMMVLRFHHVVPIELIWLGSASPLLGGGGAVLVGFLLSMITDATTEEERAMAFMRSHVASLCGNLSSPAIASIVMERVGPWPPLWLAVAVLVISAVAILFVPETLKHKNDQEPAESEPTTLKSRISHIIDQFKKSLFILKSPSLILLLLTALGSTPVIYATLSFMAQFISKRYDIKLFQTGYVQSAYGAAQVIHALIILPWLTKRLIKSTTPARFRSPDEHHRDLSLARWSFGVLSIGALVLGLSPTLAGFVFGLVLMALGSGFNSLSRSLMTLYIDPQHTSRLFSLVSMVEVVGSMFAQPMLASLFTLGLNLEGGWIGLPYYGLAALQALATVLLLFVRVPKMARDSSSIHANGHHQD
ncbi:MFS general substrate transporter [Xylariaceae sp. FL0662B]|nr:MFS general substrate transporter [Xylariaceae sp. FL0662B]